MMVIAVISALYAPGAYFSVSSPFLFTLANSLIGSRVFCCQSLIGPDIFLVTGAWIGVGPKFWVYLPITTLCMLVTIIMLWRPRFSWPKCLSPEEVKEKSNNDEEAH